MTPNEKKMLTELSSIPHGIVLRALIDKKMNFLRDVTLAKTWDETLGRQYAVKVLEDIISYMDADNAEPKPKPSYQ